MIKKMTAIRIAADREKEQMHDTPLFPCSVYISDWKKGGIESIPWHWHNEIEMMYIYSGSAIVEYAGEKSILEEGDGFFCNSRVLHKYQINSIRCRVCYLVFDEALISGGIGTIFYQKYLHPIISNSAFPGKFLFRRNKQDREVIKKIMAAFTAAKNEPQGFELDIRYNLGKALIILGDEQNLSADSCITPTMERIKEMVDYIHGHYSEPISTCELAEYAGISEREAQRCFSRVFRLTPRQYIQNYRLQVATEMLLETSQSILEIGIACGFSNPSHFSKAFRLYQGCSPHVFRKRNNEKN